jgi:hypothetical protein
VISYSFIIPSSLFFSDWPHNLILQMQTLFAAAVAPSCSLSRLLHAILWLWVYALHFALANQTLPHAIAEDVLNHPERPLPAGRVSVGTARILRWIMNPLCLLLSSAYGPRTMLASCVASLALLAYNEGDGARSHWLVRNSLVTVGYVIAEAGTTLVVCTSLSRIGHVPKKV